jgi:hypothetical protein
MPTRTRIWRRLGLMAGALAFLCQVFAWSVASPSMAFDLSSVSICTDHGTETVRLGPDGLPKGDDDGQHGGGGCPLCALMGGLSTAPPAFIPLPPRTIAHVNDATSRGLDAVPALFLSSVQARAPPRTA